MPNNEFVKNFITAYIYNTENDGGIALKTAVESKEFTVNVAEITSEGPSSVPTDMQND